MAAVHKPMADAKQSHSCTQARSAEAPKIVHSWSTAWLCVLLIKIESTRDRPTIHKTDTKDRVIGTKTQDSVSVTHSQ